MEDASGIEAGKTVVKFRSVDVGIVVSVVSAVASVAAVLLPQDAKEIAAIATNIKTNFFIFFAFLNL